MARQAAAWVIPTIRDQPSWQLQAYAAVDDSSAAERRRVEGLGAEFLKHCETEYPKIFERHSTDDGDAQWLVQIASVEKDIHVASTPARQLSSPRPGGIHRMQMEPGAPSRSFLKIEEALERIGEVPRSGQKVVDLGAAPGGWSYAFLRRGCHVMAVDHAKLKLQDLDFPGHRLEHLLEDGLKFRPREKWIPVDWLVSDMLIPPGVTLGLLRKWAERGWMRRFIVNIKLPQKEAYPALRPVEEFLASATGGDFTIRQLYHDRREVTAWGRIVGATKSRTDRRPTRKGGAPNKGGGARGTDRHKRPGGARKTQKPGGRR